jgi:hypothetical protein
MKNEKTKISETAANAYAAISASNCVSVCD